MKLFFTLIGYVRVISQIEDFRGDQGWRFSVKIRVYNSNFKYILIVIFDELISKKSEHIIFS